MTETFDEKRIDMMMEKYKDEILKMQRAGLPPPIEEEKEERNVENSADADDFLTSLKEERNKRRLIFNKGEPLRGKIGIFEGCPDYLKLLEGDVKLRFSSFSDSLPDTQRGEKLLEIKLKNFCLPLISLPAFFCDSFLDFKSLIKYRLSDFYDRGALWNCLLINKNSLDALLYNFSDMGTPSGYENTGYFSPAYLYIKENEKRAFKLLLEPFEKVPPFSDFEAGEAGACDRDYLKRSLLQKLEGAGKAEFKILLQEGDTLTPPSFSWEEREKTPVGKLTLEGRAEDFNFDMDEIPKGFYLLKEAFCDAVRQFKRSEDEDSSFNENAFTASCFTSDSGFLKAAQRLKNMDGAEARRLRENIALSMENLKGDVLESCLMILSEADMKFTKELMDMIEA